MIQLIKSGQVSHYLGLYREGHFLHTIRRRYFDCCCVTSTSSGEDVLQQTHYFISIDATGFHINPILLAQSDMVIR